MGLAEMELDDLGIRPTGIRPSGNKPLNFGPPVYIHTIFLYKEAYSLDPIFDMDS